MMVGGDQAARFAILAIVARLQPVAACIVDQLWPAFSMEAIPALRSPASNGVPELSIYCSCGLVDCGCALVCGGRSPGTGLLAEAVRLDVGADGLGCSFGSEALARR